MMPQTTDGTAPPMNLVQGAIWGYRIFLHREPADWTEIEMILSACRTPRQIKRFFAELPEYRSRLDRCGEPATDAPAIQPDFREGIRWGYRFYFEQEPSDENVNYQLARVSLIDHVRQIFLFSPEFELLRGCGVLDLRDIAILRNFAPFCRTPAPPDSFHDFLGTRTRLDCLPPAYAFKAGTVEDGPWGRDAGLHGRARWMATLRTVIEAPTSLVAVELGAGWAPWLVAAATAARKRGIANIQLTAVEESTDYVARARQHFLDNGLDPDAHAIVHLAVGAESDQAEEPDGDRPPHTPAGWTDVQPEANVVTLDDRRRPAKSRLALLRDILETLPTIDLLYCDVAGIEDAFLTMTIDRLDASVRRLIVSTHSRQAELDLLELFSGRDWILEHERPCTVGQTADRSVASIEAGEQIWHNIRVSAR